MNTITLKKLLDMKQAGEKISCLTTYDASFARVFSEAEIDIIFVGDTLGSVIQGHKETIPVNVDEIAYHVRNVRRGNNGHSLVMADMPFMSYATPEQACENAAKLMQAGAQVIKLEGGAWLAETIAMLTERGIPVCAHLGLTPQSVHLMGGYRVQGKEQEQADKIYEDAIALNRAGAKLLVLECVPSSLAKDISQSIAAATIGIGAGPECDGQVLVSYDILGLSGDNLPKFVQVFLDAEAPSIAAAAKKFNQAVKSGQYPAAEHCY